MKYSWFLTVSISAEAFVSERWISCNLYCVIELFAVWPKICKKSVFVILLYFLLFYGGTIVTILFYVPHIIQLSVDKLPSHFAQIFFINLKLCDDHFCQGHPIGTDYCIYI